MECFLAFGLGIPNCCKMTPKKPIGPYENPSFQTQYNPGQDIVGHDDRFLRNLENEGSIKILGALYDVATGEVSFR